MAAVEDFSSISQVSQKENRRHSAMTTPIARKKRSTHGNANVLNPMFGRLPDPLRCHPPDGLQFHEINAAIPDFSAFRRRDDDPTFVNRRLSHSGVASLSANTPGLAKPLSRTDPMVQQPTNVGIAMSSENQKRVSYYDAGPLIKEAQANKTRKEAAYKASNMKQSPKVDSAVDPDSRPETRDSTTSTRSAGSRVGWDTQDSLHKSHSTLGIDIALKPVDNNIENESKAPYFSSPVKVSPRVQAARTESDDTPSIKVPSCSGLPIGWDTVHDRCIAYLSTHAPLTESGKIPVNETTVERYTTEEISDFLIVRFARFRHLKKIPHWAIEKRLQMLDLNENEYFRVQYGGYKFEDWGRDI